MGHYEYGLKSLADEQLLSGLARIVQRRNEITAEFLAYLAELDERQLFLDLGFSSLFEYCTVKLGLCESTAGRHIAAARVCRSHPQVFEMVASGALHASALSLLKKHLTGENAAELFELCSRRSARRVEELLAARFPRPDVNDLVRRLPAPSARTLDVGCCVAAEEPSRELQTEASPQAIALGPAPEQQFEQKTPVESLSHEQSVTLGATQASKPRRPEPLSADRFGVHFTADGEFCALLERVRGLAGHRLPSGDLMTLLKRGLEAYERELEKQRFAVGRKGRRNRDGAPASGALAGPALSKPAPPHPNPSDPTLSRPEFQPKPRPSQKRRPHYPAAVARAVFLRDGKQCTYVSPDGRRCSARWRLELDHIEPAAVGGEATIENLRLRCRAHNQWYARQYFGRFRVSAAMLASSRRRAAPSD